MHRQSPGEADPDRGSLNLSRFGPFSENVQMSARDVSKRLHQIGNALDRIKAAKKSYWKFNSLCRQFQSGKILQIQRIGNDHNLLLRHLAPLTGHLRDRW